MDSPASELSRRLAQDAEAVCRHSLPHGRRQGRYWIVGDAGNTPGRSLYVRLDGPTKGRGAAGKWAEHVGAPVMLRRCHRGLALQAASGVSAT
jgi:hypothetical protein